MVLLKNKFNLLIGKKIRRKINEETGTVLRICLCSLSKEECGEICKTEGQVFIVRDESGAKRGWCWSIFLSGKEMEKYNDTC